MENNEAYLLFSKEFGSEAELRGVFLDCYTIEEKAKELVRKDIKYLRLGAPELEGKNDDEFVETIVDDLSHKNSGEWTYKWSIDYMYMLVEPNKLL